MMNIIPCPHRRELLRRQEQPSLVQLEPVWSLRRTCWGCGALVFSGPCNTSHLQLITSVFVSNRMETRLKINVNHTMYRVRCGTAQGMQWRWFGGPSAQQGETLPGPGWVGFYILLDILLSQLCGILCFFFLLLLHLWWLCKRRSDKAARSPNVSTLYTFLSMNTFTNAFLI